jgi:dihydroorotase
MPNTEPTVDSASVLRSLRDSAAADACVPVGFLASITLGLRGEALTEMAELRETGALGFTDDGLPVVSAGLLQRALQYQRLCGGVIALHEEDPTLSGAGVMHEGEVSAALGMTGIPSISESTMIARDAAIAGYETARIHVQHVSCRESIAAVAAAKAGGVRITAEVTPHHLVFTDEAIRGELHTRFKMNPPLRAEADRAGARGGAAGRHHRLRGHRPRPATRGTRRRCRSRRRRWARRAWRPPSPRSTPSSCSRARSRWPR